MFILAKIRIIPSIVLDLKDDMTLCASCVFGTARKIQWITKGKRSGSIRKDTDNKSVYRVSVDQLQSDHTG